MPFSRGSSPPSDRTLVSCIAGRFFTIFLSHQGSPSSSGVGPQRGSWRGLWKWPPLHRCPLGAICPLSWSKASSGEKGLRDEDRKFSWHSLASLLCPPHLTAHTFLYSGYYSAIKKKKHEVLPFAETQMDFEGIMLSEISQTEKDEYYLISLICEI